MPTNEQPTEVASPRYSAVQLGRRTVAQVAEIEARVRHYAQPWWRRWTRRAPGGWQR